VDILFETDPNGTSRQDWAAWGSPRMVQSEITQDFDSKDYDSAQRFRGLINEYGGIPLAGGSRTDRGWIASAFTTEIVLPEIPPQSTLRSEVFVLTPSQNENDSLTISLVSEDGSILEQVVHPANVDVKEIADEFELGAYPDPPSKIHYTVSAESAPTLFLKQPVYKHSIQTRESRANVILISLDTLRPDYLGCYGNPNQYSPNIDSFASESLLFQNVYSSSNWTLPAHASLFTSLYSTDHQIVPRSWGGSAYVSFENDYYYLTEAFKEANYVTLAHTGGGFVDSRYGFNRAFDYHIENVVELNEETLANLVSMVESHKDAPHFLFFHTFEIHDYPNQKPKYQRYVSKSFWTGKLSFERRLSAQHFLDLPSFRNIAREILPETGTQYARELYAGALSRTDELLGSFFRQLRELDLYDQSWIIVTSDHGEGFGEEHNNNSLTSWRHGRRLYDNQIRIPLIIKPPKGLVRRELPIIEEQFVELIDIAPTLMAVLGKKPHPQFKGRNLLPVFSKPNSIKARAAFSDDIRNRQFSVLADGYKLLASPNREMQMDTRYELYNLVKDSPERRNLIRDLGDSDLFYDLKLLLENHIREVSPGRFAYTPGIEEDLDQEHLERLRDLGYIQ
jgi:arylsulfatase A-like enzyme